MDLQLGLSLPTNALLDLKSYAYVDSNILFPPNRASSSTFHDKRSFTQLFDNTRETLPLLPLTPGHSNHLDDPEDRLSNSSTITKNDDGDDVVVGWPPVNSRRKKLRQDSCGFHDDQTVEVNRCDCVNVGLGLYVKVNMEGVGIGRKVDLRLHQSFETLKETLMDMFGKRHEDSSCYVLAYQDEERDWLVAEDVPWRSFIRCAQRLKLLKSRG